MRSDPLAATVSGSPSSSPVVGEGVTATDRDIARVLLRLGLWRRKVWMRMVDVEPKPGWRRRVSGWIYDGMLRRQMVDRKRHAPACPANHYHRKRLVLLGCICGATEERPA